MIEMMDEDTEHEDTIVGIMADLDYIKDSLQGLKSGERSEQDRYLAIAITELEKLYSFIGFYLDK